MDVPFYLPPGLRNRTLPRTSTMCLIPFSRDNATYQNSWEATEAGPEEKFLSLDIYTREQKGSQTYGLSFYPIKLEKEGQIKPNIQKTVKISVEINEIKMTNVRNEKGNLTTDSTDIIRIKREYYGQLYATKLENLAQGLEKFLYVNN